MKKSLCYIVSIISMLCLMVCFGVSASAEELEEFVEDYFVYTVTDGEATIVDVEDEIEGEIEIPETLGGYLVVCIGDSAFKYNSNISSVVIPDGVKKISNYAFDCCYNLKNIYFGSGLESIGTCAFFNCDSLTEVKVPLGVKKIYNTAFSDCDNLEYVYIPESVTEIYMYVFNNCYRLKGIWVDENNSKYSNDEVGALFNKDKSKLCYYPTGKLDKEYVVPDSVKIINNYAFNNCAYIERVICGSGVEIIKEMSFENCKRLKEIVFLGDSLQTIEDNAFRDCVSLQEISIPDSVISIGDHTYDGCINAENIEIGNNVETIGSGAFWGCEKVENIFVPDSVIELGTSIFTDCFNLENIEVDENNEYYSSEQGVLFNKNKTQLVRYPLFKQDVVYIVPESVVSFEYYAFTDCKYIEEVVLGSNITTLSSCLFQDCERLKKVEFLGNLTTINNSSFENCVNLSEITIPESVTRIDFWAFRNCDSLKEIRISKNIVNIGDFAFGNCDKLENIFVDELNEYYCSDENGVLYNKNKTILIQYPTGKKDASYSLSEETQTIASNAFSDNVYLENVYLNNKLTAFDYDSFQRCEKLKELHITENIQKLDSYSFNGCKSLERITVDSNNAYYSDVNGVLFNKDKTYLICYPDSYDLKEYYIPDTVTTIECVAFADSVYLEKVFIPARVDTIYQESFARCISLSDIIVDENNVNYITDENGVLFTYDKDMIIQYPSAKTDSIYIIPDSVDSAGPNLFEGNNYLKHVILSPNMCYIDAAIFSGCKILETVTIPSRINYIGIDAFLGCESLHSVYYVGSEYDWNMIDIEIKNDAVKNAKKYFDITWNYDSGVLSFTGPGYIPETTDHTYYPWSQYADVTYEVVLDGVTSVVANAFADFVNLKSVIIDGKNTEIVGEEIVTTYSDVEINSGAFSNCQNLSIVVSYANINVEDDAITKDADDVNYFIKAGCTNENLKIPFVEFDFVPYTIQEVFDDGSVIDIYTFNTEVRGNISFTQEEIICFMAALDYGSDENFINILFNEFTAEDFKIYKYTSLSPLKGEEVDKISNAKLYGIILVDPEINEYMSLSMSTFCDFLSDETCADIDYKFAVLEKTIESENPENNGGVDDGSYDEEEEKEPNAIVRIFATVLEAIKKLIKIISKLFK